MGQRRYFFIQKAEELKEGFEKNGFLCRCYFEVSSGKLKLVMGSFE